MVVAAMRGDDVLMTTTTMAMMRTHIDQAPVPMETRLCDDVVALFEV